MNKWDNIAELYNNHVKREGDVYHKTYINPKIIELLGDVKDKKILDLACGNGYFTEILANKSAITFGVDYSEKLIDFAKAQKKVNAIYTVGKSDSLEFTDNYFDSIIINMALQDIENIEGTFSEAYRVLKKDGSFIFSIPHPAFFMSTTENDGNEIFKRLELYMTNISFDHPVFPGVSFHHRTIGYYLTTLIKHNFILNKFEELTVKHDKGKLITDQKLMALKKEIPSFLIIKAIKQV